MVVTLLVHMVVITAVAIMDMVMLMPVRMLQVIIVNMRRVLVQVAVLVHVHPALVRRVLLQGPVQVVPSLQENKS